MTGNNTPLNTDILSQDESSLPNKEDSQIEIEITPCPDSIGDPVLQDESKWTPYTESHGTIGHVGNFLFHGNQDTFVENKQPSLESPQQECVFDRNGNIIDENHPYAEMGGSANYYSDSFNHTFVDPGGIAERGGEGFATSMEHYYDSTSASISEGVDSLYADSWLESGVKYFEKDSEETTTVAEQPAVEAAVVENPDEGASLFEPALDDASELNEVCYFEPANDFSSTTPIESATTEIFSSPEFDTISFDTPSFESPSVSSESTYSSESGSYSEGDYGGEY